jgi:UDP-GlcNAc3NAcA epimerase
MRFASIVGARPQFIKLAPVSQALRAYHEEIIVHTGQHYDEQLSAVLFRELRLPEPDYHLRVGSGPQGEQTGHMLAVLEAVLLKERPDGVLVYGDTNSTLAGALAAAKLHLPLTHIEAGLRSYNRAMPEEINRVVTDHLASRLFCPTETARACLRREGIVAGVDVVGDVMYDALLQARPALHERAETLLPALGLAAGAYVLATVHRQANTDDPAALVQIAGALNALARPVVFPLHPRTRAALARGGITLREHIHPLDPVGYLDMLALEQHAQCVVTDSGGVQKEAFLLGVPCVTLRDETEWPETVAAGGNVLVGCRTEAIVAAVEHPPCGDRASNPFGAGDAAQRIAQALRVWPPAPAQERDADQATGWPAAELRMAVRET